MATGVASATRHTFFGSTAMRLWLAASVLLAADALPLQQQQALQYEGLIATQLSRTSGEAYARRSSSTSRSSQAHATPNPELAHDLPPDPLPKPWPVCVGISCPICVNTRSFNAGHGWCSTYEPGESNNPYCNFDNAWEECPGCKACRLGDPPPAQPPGAPPPPPSDVGGGGGHGGHGGGGGGALQPEPSPVPVPVQPSPLPQPSASPLPSPSPLPNPPNGGTPGEAGSGSDTGVIEGGSGEAGSGSGEAGSGGASTPWSNPFDPWMGPPSAPDPPSAPWVNPFDGVNPWDNPGESANAGQLTDPLTGETSTQISCAADNIYQVLTNARLAVAGGVGEQDKTWSTVYIITLMVVSLIIALFGQALATTTTIAMAFTTSYMMFFILFHMTITANQPGVAGFVPCYLPILLSFLLATAISVGIYYLSRRYYWLTTAMLTFATTLFMMMVLRSIIVAIVPEAMETKLVRYIFSGVTFVASSAAAIFAVRGMVPEKRRSTVLLVCSSLAGAYGFSIGFAGLMVLHGDGFGVQSGLLFILFPSMALGCYFIQRYITSGDAASNRELTRQQWARGTRSAEKKIRSGERALEASVRKGADGVNSRVRGASDRVMGRDRSRS